MESSHHNRVKQPAAPDRVAEKLKAPSTARDATTRNVACGCLTCATTSLFHHDTS